MSPLLIVGPVLPQADRLREHGGPDIQRCKEKLPAIVAALGSAGGIGMVMVRSEFLDANPPEAGRDLLRQHDVPVLVIANAAEDGLRFVVDGCAGILKSDVSIEELLHLLPRVAAGEIWASPMLLSRALRRVLKTETQCTLTSREQQIFELVAKGLTNRQIAEDLCITRETVRWHLRGINTKLGRSSVEDLRRQKLAERQQAS